MSEDIFMQASRTKLRFPAVTGQLSAEDLWEIPLTTVRSNKASIENIGATVLARQSELQGASILVTTTASPEKKKVDLQVAILRKVGEVRQAENAAKTAAAAKASEKARLEKLIREREDKELPIDELKARVAAL